MNKKKIMTAVYQNGKIIIFDENGYYVSKRIEGQLYSYNSDFVAILNKKTNELIVLDVDAKIVTKKNLQISYY